MTEATKDKTTLMERVRKLLAQAEDDGVTPAEAEAFTERAATLMARYGIEKAMLGALHPETDKQSDRKVPILNPWASVRSHLLGRLAKAMRCEAVLLKGRNNSQTVHLFGFESDLERVDVLYTSLLIQMTHALLHEQVPLHASYRPSDTRAYRRSFLLGYVAEVSERVAAAEERAASQSKNEDDTRGGPGTALVLADRSLAVRAAKDAAYPKLRNAKITYSGGGYERGQAEGRRADIGTTRVGGNGQRALPR